VTYVALLRGINVGGNRVVDMKTLKGVFETAGMTSVRTFINSGNVVFSTKLRSRARLTSLLEKAIEKKFGFPVDVLLVSDADLTKIAGAIPEEWTNEGGRKCDVFFLWDDVDRRSILEEIEVDPKIESVRYTPGALIWSIDRANEPASRVPKLVGTATGRRMTVRNCNTTRKLLGLMTS
jgi:uncharacterized protein (DUF1697 family)